MADWQTRGEARNARSSDPTEEALQDLLKSFDKRMQRLNDQYLQMMGEHLADIGTLWPSDVHRLQQIRRMNRNLSALRRRIANAANAGEKEVQKAFELIAKGDVRMASKILGMPDAVNVSSNAYLKNILQAQARETAGRMENLANSTVSSDAYRRAVDTAVSAVQSGVEDYGSAIRRSIREAGQMGLRVRENGTTAVEYASGHTRRLDSAVRMNILDGVRHLNQSIMDEVGRQLGADGIEIDAHMLCAEDHLPYQGRQFSNADFEAIQSSLPRPFGEWNCRHSWHPILLGISQPAYDPEELRAMEDYSNEEIEIDGRTKTRYQWSQEMRRMETAVRQQKDTATLAKAAGDAQLERRCKGTILQLNEKYKSVAEQAGLKPEFQRTFVQGYRDGKMEGGLTESASSSIVIKENQIASADWNTVTVRKTDPMQHGFSAFPDGDVLKEYSKRIIPEDGFYDVAMHGQPDAVAFGKMDAYVSPRELASFILHRDDYNGESIRLLSCSTGRAIDGDYCFAEHLANALGVTVLAPTDLLYVKHDGTFYVGIKKEGIMRLFKPNERRRIK